MGLCQEAPPPAHPPTMNAKQVLPELGSFPVGPSQSLEEPRTPSLSWDGGREEDPELPNAQFPGIPSSVWGSIFFQGCKSEQERSRRACFLPCPQDRV